MSSNDLALAIYQARQNPANASFFASSPSNYLTSQSLKTPLTVPQLNLIAGTGTYNYQTSSGLVNIIGATHGPNNSINLVANTRTNSSNPPATLPPGSTPSGPNNSPVGGNSLTTAFNSGLNQVGSVFQTHPIAIVAIGALVAFLVLRK